MFEEMHQGMFEVMYKGMPSDCPMYVLRCLRLHKTQRLGVEFVTKEKKVERERIYYPYRILALLIFVLLFLPAVNPGCISSLISKSTSLLTAGLSYARLIENMGRPLKKLWVLPSTMQLLRWACVGIDLGILAIAAGVCLSPGNYKCKKLGNILSFCGSAAGLAGMFGIYKAYGQIALTEKPDKIEPALPASFVPIVVLFAVMALLSVILFATVKKKENEEEGFFMEEKYRLFLLLLPFILLTFVFSYLPLWGLRYAFFDYKSGDTLSMKNFVGLKWFAMLVRNAQTRKDIVRVLRNTLAMSALGLATAWCPMAFAIFLSEIKNTRFRRFVQTFTTIPNFISWVLVFAIAFCIFSTDGFISSLMINLGIWETGKNFLMNGDHTWIKMLLWGMWKGLGWSAIIYIAGISGIDQSLYEAATVDGAGRFQRMWHVTVPGLMPTFFVLFLMAVAGALNNGLDQYLVFENTSNTSQIMVLDLYVYKMGIVNGSIPFSTAVGMLKSVVSVVLLFLANGVSKRLRGETII